MKLPVHPNFNPHPGRGNALGPVVGSAISEEAIGKVFDVVALAGMGRLHTLTTGRARALRGLAAPNTESRPDIVAEAQARANAQGIPLTCREDIVSWAPGQVYYNRCCSVPGSGCIFGADPIATYTQAYQWDNLRLDIANETGAGAAHGDSQGIWSGGELTPYHVLTQGVTSPLPAPVIGTPPPLPPPEAPPEAPPLTSQERAIQGSNRPGKSVTSSQPGETPVPPGETTGDKITNGLNDEAETEWFNFGQMGSGGMGLMLLAGVAVVALIAMKGGD